MTPSPRQIRAARALLGIPQAELAKLAGMSPTGLANIERGAADPKASTVDAIRAALEAEGVEFLADEGVKLRPGAGGRG